MPVVEAEPFNQDNDGVHAGMPPATLTPAIAGKKYFDELAIIFNAGGPPGIAKVKETMTKYGLVPA